MNDIVVVNLIINPSKTQGETIMKLMYRKYQDNSSNEAKNGKWYARTVITPTLGSIVQKGKFAA